MRKIDIDLQEYTNMVHKIAWNFNDLAERLNVEHDDLYQVGMMGLWKASINFDPSRGLKFSTLATIAIQNVIKNYLRDLRVQKRAAILLSFDALTVEGGRDWHNYNADTRASNEYKSVEIRESLRELLTRLPNGKQKILECMLNTGLTAKTGIARYCNISQSYVAQAFISIRPELECLR